MTISLVSVSSDGVQGDTGGFLGTGGAISADGRYVTFYTQASNLVAGGTNGGPDIYVRDLVTGTTTLLTPGGNQSSYEPSISADGRYVTFYSQASNLAAGDTNGSTYIDIYVRDLVTGTTTLLTPGGNGSSYEPSISADGRYVTFYSQASNLAAGDTNGTTFYDIYVHDLVTGSTTLLTPGSNSHSLSPEISADGRYVTFASNASNLVDGDTNGTVSDVFVHDIVTGTTALLATSGNNDSFQPSISADGRYVSFASYASNLVAGDPTAATIDVFVRDLVTGTTTLLTPGGNGASVSPDISADGRYVVFASDASNLVAADGNGQRDIFIRDPNPST